MEGRLYRKIDQTNTRHGVDIRLYGTKKYDHPDYPSSGESPPVICHQDGTFVITYIIENIKLDFF